MWTFRSSYDELFLQILWGIRRDSSTPTNELSYGMDQENFYIFGRHQINLEDASGLDHFQLLGFSKRLGLDERS